MQINFIKLFLYFSLAIILSGGCKKNYSGSIITDKHSPNEASRVTIVEVVEKTDPIPIETYGIVASSTLYNISFKNGGLIERLFLREGDFVKRGALLAQLKSDEIDVQVDKLKNILAKAARDVDRIESLYTDSAATLEQVEDLRTAFQISKADLEIFEHNQQNTSITSPVNGRVIKKFVEENERVSPGQTIYELSTSYDAKIIKAQLSDKDIAKISIGTPAIVKLDAYPHNEMDATVIKIPESSNAKTGTFEIELLLNNGKIRLRNGYYGTVSLLPKNSLQYFEIPMNSIVESEKNSIFVFVPNTRDSTVSRLELEVLRINNLSVLVLTDTIVNKVVSIGAQYLKDGDKIIW